MKINITTTIEIDKDDGEPLTTADLDEAYANFRELLKETNNGKDITAFLFINPDTNMEIEDELEEV